ncbi:uncharacterized protein RHOBADRAFT_55430, partial [Rhodotorula graminis WP1]
LGSRQHAGHVGHLVQDQRALAALDRVCAADPALERRRAPPPRGTGLGSPRRLVGRGRRGGRRGTGPRAGQQEEGAAGPGRRGGGRVWGWRRKEQARQSRPGRPARHPRPPEQGLAPSRRADARRPSRRRRPHQEAAVPPRDGRRHEHDVAHRGRTAAECLSCSRARRPDQRGPRRRRPRAAGAARARRRGRGRRRTSRCRTAAATATRRGSCPDDGRAARAARAARERRGRRRRAGAGARRHLLGPGRAHRADRRGRRVQAGRLFSTRPVDPRRLRARARRPVRPRHAARHGLAAGPACVSLGPRRPHRGVRARRAAAHARHRRQAHGRGDGGRGRGSGRQRRQGRQEGSAEEDGQGRDAVRAAPQAGSSEWRRERVGLGAKHASPAPLDRPQRLGPLLAPHLALPSPILVPPRPRPRLRARPRLVPPRQGRRALFVAPGPRPRRGQVVVAARARAGRAARWAPREGAGARARVVDEGEGLRAPGRAQGAGPRRQEGPGAAV